MNRYFKLLLVIVFILLGMFLSVPKAYAVDNCRLDNADGGNIGNVYQPDSQSCINFWYPFYACHPGYKVYFEGNLVYTESGSCASAPSISSPTKTDITGTSATLGGNVTSDGGATITGRGVCVGTSANPALGGNCFSTSGTTGVFTVSATSLSNGTLYHYRAYATNSVGTSYTTDDTFTTLSPPTITTPTKTPIHGSDATLGGNVTSDGGATITGRGVCVGTSANPALGGNCFSTSGTTGVFTVSATSLTQSTLYHYRAYATNSVGTSYTTDDTFTTLALNNYLVTVASPQTAGVCSTGTNTVTARDSTNTTITTDTSTVNMTNSGTSVTFYTTSGCTVSTTQYTLTSGVANIYYKTNLAQSFTITATKNGSTETGTSSSITVNAGSMTRLVITLPSQTFTAGSGNSGSVDAQTAGSSFTITKISATDDYFNLITSYSGAKTLAYSGPANAPNGQAPSYTTSVSFTSGQSTTALTTTLYKAETTTITVTDTGSYGYASSSVTVNPGAINNYLVTVSTPQTAGVCFTGTNTITARDAWNNTRTTDSSIVNMTSSGTGITFYTSGTCATPTTQYTMSSGTSNIYIKTNKAQTFTVTATRNGGAETGTSSSITINANSQTRLVITLPSETFTDGAGNSGSVANQTAGIQFTITKISATDDYFNVITGYSGAKTLAYSGPSSSLGTPSYTTSVSFTNGQSTTTLNTTLYTPETTTITVTDGGLYGYASSPLTVSPRGINFRGKVQFRGKVNFQP